MDRRDTPSTRPPAARMLASRALLLMGALTAAGCAEPTAERAALSETEFIEIVVALREAARDLHPDSVDEQFERRRAEILSRHDATEEDLRRFVVARHERSRSMAVVWDTIAQRLRGEAPTGEPGGPELLIEEAW